ncbi:DUF5789 family protein [Halegenticoccus tardaugens]|uniref:DUF5789 family protein n=1 Tax=Halegenticoccus tardaugens TaxID=2071624 RepID=UPI00100B78C4|nr:hypothetical protein [Halegenticoccus tardaugens]
MEDTPDSAGDTRPLDINRVLDLFDGEELPATTDEIRSAFGDVEVSYPGGGSESLGAVFDASGDETYRTVDDLQLAVLNGVRRNAVGRPRYSDRDPPTLGEGRDLEHSF